MEGKTKILFPTAQGAVKKGTVAIVYMVSLGTMTGNYLRSQNL